MGVLAGLEWPSASKGLGAGSGETFSSQYAARSNRLDPNFRPIIIRKPISFSYFLIPNSAEGRFRTYSAPELWHPFHSRGSDPSDLYPEQA